jgi:hypothetical protein
MKEVMNILFGNQEVLNSIGRNIRLTLKIATGMFVET